MFKKLIVSATATAVLATTIATFAFAAEPPVNPRKVQAPLDIIVNGLKISFPDAEPYADENNRTLVPVRFISEKLGAEVKWDNANQIVTIITKEKTAAMQLKSKTATVNGEKVELDTAAVSDNGRTMVPLRFVSDVLGAKLIWDELSNSIQIQDAAFQAKVEAGSVKLNPWGRLYRQNTTTNLPKTATFWSLLEDVPNWAYDVALRERIAPWGTMASDKTAKEDFANFNKPASDDGFGGGFTKTQLDRMANDVRQMYKTVLNQDYRTISAKTYSDDTVPYQFIQGGIKPGVFDNYISFVKKNKIVTEGYASPEPDTAYVKMGLFYMRVKFKFRIVQSGDVSQSFMDSYNPSSKSESPKNLKVGVWYEGYSDVRFNSNSANYQRDYIAPWSTEHMFIKGAYQYKELKAQ